MKTVGEILKQARLKKNLSLEEVEKITKIRKKYLLAFEENDLKKLPSFTFSRGLLKNYSDYLGLPSKELIAIYRRQTNEEEYIDLLPKETLKDYGKLYFRWTSVLGAVFSVFLIFFFYLFPRFPFFWGKPYLKILSPRNNLVLKNEVLEIKGKTEPGMVLLINNQEVTVQENGNFITKVKLKEGENRILVIAKDKKGKENRKEIKVYYRNNK